CLGELADTRGQQGDIAAARDLYRRAIVLFGQVLGVEAQPTLFYRRRLAVLVAEHGEARAALTELDSLVEAARRRLGPEHPRVGQPLLDRGHVLHLPGDATAAAASMRQAIAVPPPTPAPDEP